MSKLHYEKIVCPISAEIFKRLALLRRLIQNILKQKVKDYIKIEIMIFDNDVEKSVEEIVTEFYSQTSTTISYCARPIYSMSLTRNMALD